MLPGMDADATGPDYLAVNRYGLVPALRHRGLTVVQSNVILDYLARATAGGALNKPDFSTFYTPGTKGYTDYA